MTNDIIYTSGPETERFLITRISELVYFILFFQSYFLCSRTQGRQVRIVVSSSSSVIGALNAKPTELSCGGSRRRARAGLCRTDHSDRETRRTDYPRTGHSSHSFACITTIVFSLIFTHFFYFCYFLSLVYFSVEIVVWKKKFVYPKAQKFSEPFSRPIVSSRRAYFRYPSLFLVTVNATESFAIVSRLYRCDGKSVGRKKKKKKRWIENKTLLRSVLRPRSSGEFSDVIASLCSPPPLLPVRRTL